MATFTVNVYPGSNGPNYTVTGPTGNTIVINDYMYTQNLDKVANPVSDQHGRKGKQTSVTI